MMGHVLLVRAESTPDSDHAELVSRGFAVTRDPYLQINTSADPAAGQRARTLVDALGPSSWLILASAAGIRALTDLVGETALRDQLREAETAGARFAAVGPTSRDALLTAGAQSVAMPTTGHTASALLSLLAAERPATAILPRSSIADAIIPKTLAVRGWTVMAETVYDTDPVTDRPSTADALAAGSFDVVVVRSPSAARAVVRFTGGLPATTAVVAGGPTTALAAARLGLTVRAVARESTPAGIAIAVATAVADAA